MKCLENYYKIIFKISFNLIIYYLIYGPMNTRVKHEKCLYIYIKNIKLFHKILKSC